jgi:hypothetical protein
MNFPKFLYKYTSEHGLDILKNAELKVTPPNDLNDAFELSSFLAKPVTTKHIED